MTEDAVSSTTNCTSLRPIPAKWGPEKDLRSYPLRYGETASELRWRKNDALFSFAWRVGVRGSNPDSVIKVCAAEFDSIERIFRKIAPKTRKLFNSLGRKVKMKVVYSFPASRTVYFHTVHLFFSLLVWFFIRQNYFYDLKTRFWKRVTLNTEKFIKLEMIFFVRRRLDEKFEIFEI